LSSLHVYIRINSADIIIVSHYSSIRARIFGNNSISYFFLLSYAKFFCTLMDVISFTVPHYPDDSRTAVWLYDGNVQYLSPAHIIFLCF